MAHHSHGDTDLSPLLSAEKNGLSGDADEETFGLRNRRGKPQQSSDSNINSPLASSPEPLVAIFAVDFDVKKGNVLEWSQSRNGMDLKGVEFKALPSGAHTIPSDFTIFKFGEYYGLACFEMVKDEFSSRGANLKSVGILALDFNQLISSREFLAAQVKKLHSRPGVFHELEEWFHRTSVDVPDRSTSQVVFPGRNALLAFLRQMDAQLFVLWKLISLRKRVLFVSDPPVETLCLNVFLASLLDSSSEQQSGSLVSFNTLFFVDLNDVEKLRLTPTYTACTTEKIFEIKTDLYDAIIVDGNVRIHDKVLQESCTVTPADQQRFTALLGRIVKGSRHDYGNYSDLVDSSSLEEARTLFVDAFTDLNDNILTALRSASSFGEGKITSENVESWTLDASRDIAFLTALASVRGFRVELPQTVWCPSCRCC